MWTEGPAFSERITTMGRRDSDRFEDVEVAFEEVKHETSKAYLLIVSDEEFWIPKSQVRSMRDDYVIIPRWLAEEKGL